MGTKTCPACGGSGNPSVSGERSWGCMSCGGKGWVYDDDSAPYDPDSSSAARYTHDTNGSSGRRPATRTPEPAAKPTRSTSTGASASQGNADGFFAVAGFLVGGGYVYSSTNEPVVALIVGAIAGFIAMKIWRIAMVVGVIALAIAVFGN